MGFFSWKTSDTEKSIPSIFSGKETFTVYMATEDGRVWVEDQYEGYGVFGGKDIYELIAEMNGKTNRNEGIGLVFENNPSGEFKNKTNLKLPYLFEKEYNTANAEDFRMEFCLPRNCEFQGYFYEEYDDDDCRY